MRSFWNLMPVGYFVSQYESEDCRAVEVDTEFRLVYSDKIGRRYLKNSWFLSKDEWNCLDAEIETMQFGFEGSTVRQLMVLMLGNGEEWIENKLDTIEAKFFWRSLYFDDPKPPRNSKNLFENFWSEYFEMEIPPPIDTASII